ncbi:MAG: ornithine carbamoyltransferase [Actinobacteria bacterium]|nr:ornithine carbamoyltransferase [Actinomycetota bacterium]
MSKKNKKDFLTLKDYDSKTISYLLDIAGDVKSDPLKYSKVLEGKNIALLFDKHSTRTRLSFEAGISQMGGNAIYLDAKNLQLSRGETHADTAKIFSLYLDAVVIRTFSHRTVEIFAEEGSIPVINGLTDMYHPCQVLSDLFTIKEAGLLSPGPKITYMGDSNNVTNSLMVGLSKLGIKITISSPSEYKPGQEIMKYIESIKGSNVSIVSDPVKAAEDADIVYTDVWISMGDAESDQKVKKLSSYQLNRELLSHAAKDVIIMHCLPAHRGEEITAEVLDGSNSIVLKQAENRLYAQKALLAYIFES